MTFTAYIQRQKNLIRERREGEIYLTHKGEVIGVSEEDNLFFELSKSRGLNTRERMMYGKTAV